MILLRNHLFLSAWQLLVSAVILAIQFTSSLWQHRDLLGKVASLIPLVFLLILTTLLGHYYLRKQIVIKAWTYSVAYPLIVAVFVYYASHVVVS